MSENISIDIDSQALKEGMKTASDEAIKDACESYQIKSAISDAIRKSVLADTISKSINAAIKQIDFETLTKETAKSLTENIKRGLEFTIKGSIVQTMFRLEGLSDYAENDKERKAEIREIFGHHLKTK